jgi:hypothetical protein
MPLAKRLYDFVKNFIHCIADPLFISFIFLRGKFLLKALTDSTIRSLTLRNT